MRHDVKRWKKGIIIKEKVKGTEKMENNEEAKREKVMNITEKEMTLITRLNKKTKKDLLSLENITWKESH